MSSSILARGGAISSRSRSGPMGLPYETKLYKHLSITVQEEGQIQWLDDAQAGFRLASIAMAPPSRDRGLMGAASSGSPVAASPPAAAKPKTLRPRSQGTARGHKRAGRQQPIPCSRRGPRSTKHPIAKAPPGRD